MIYDLFALVVNWLLILLCRVEQANNKSLAELQLSFFLRLYQKYFLDIKNFIYLMEKN